MSDYEMKTSHVIALRAAFTILVAAALFLSASAYRSATPQSESKSESEIEFENQIDWHDPDSGCYLVFAEVNSSENGSTTFVTRDGNLWTTDGEYSADFPYMLTMYDFHTEDVADDCICVVWVCAERVLG